MRDLDADGLAGLHEHDVLERARLGDRAACRALVVRHQNRVFGLLRGMLAPVGRGGLVEDLAQETFLRAFRALPGFDGERAKFGTWLSLIATRVALNELRRRPPTLEAIDTVSEMLGTWRGNPATGGRLVGQAIDRAVAELPDPFRAAFLLRELHGLEYAEIASFLSIDVGTVKSRLSRARARLRKALAEVDHG